MFLSFLLCSAVGGSPRHGPGIPDPAYADPPAEAPAPIAQQVHFRHGDHLLAGTLYRVGGPGRHPAIALVLGSGAVDRDYGGAGRILGEHFARAGIHCLTWDRPGVGQSTGDYRSQSFPDRAEEALAAVRFLRGRADVHPDRVGLWGHSQGGMVAPLAAALSADVAFLIEVSGWQGPAWRQDSVRVAAELRADGFAEAAIQEATRFAQKRMELIRGTGPFEELDQLHPAVESLPWFPYVHRCDATLFYAARRLVGYDSTASWEKVHCPILVIYGDKDTSSGAPEPLVALIRQGLAKAGNQDVTVKIFANADHSLCVANAGGRREAHRHTQARRKGNGPDFVPGYLETMMSWLSRRFDARR